jgi:hypothetical protein
MRSDLFYPVALFAVFVVFGLVLCPSFYNSWLDGNAGRRLDAPVQWVDLRVALGTVFTAGTSYLGAAFIFANLAMKYAQNLRAQVKRLEGEVERLQEAADRQTRNARRLEDELDRLRGSPAYHQDSP